MAISLTVFGAALHEQNEAVVLPQGVQIERRAILFQEFSGDPHPGARRGRRLGQHARDRYRLPHRSITEVANGDRTGERGRYRRVGREIMTVETNSRRLPVLAEHGGGVDQPGLFLG